MTATVSSLVRRLDDATQRAGALRVDLLDRMEAARTQVTAEGCLDAEVLDRLESAVNEAHNRSAAAIDFHFEAVAHAIRTESLRLASLVDGRADDVGHIVYRDGRGRSRTLVEEGGPRRVQAVEKRSLDLCQGHDKDDYMVSLNAAGEYVRDPNGSILSRKIVKAEGSSGVQERLKSKTGMEEFARRVAARKSLVGDAVEVAPDDILTELTSSSGGGFQIDDDGYPVVAVTAISNKTLEQMTPPPGGGPVFLGRMVGNGSFPLSDCWFLGSTNENGDMWVLDAEGHWVRIDDEGRFRGLLAVPPEWNGDRRIAKAELDDSTEIVCAVGRVAKVVRPKVANPDGSGEYRHGQDFDGGGIQVWITEENRAPIQHVELSNQLFQDREQS